jgi:chromosome segregation ATPase
VTPNGWATLAAVIAASGSVAAAWVAARSHQRAASAQTRADERTADAEQAIAVIEQWSAIVTALQKERTALLNELAGEREAHAAETLRRNDELERHIAELGRAAGELTACEKRCKECHEKVGDLLASLAALGALVTDEVTRAAVVTVIEGDRDAVDDATEAAAIRAWLNEVRRQQRTEEGQP